MFFLLMACSVISLKHNQSPYKFLSFDNNYITGNLVLDSNNSYTFSFLGQHSFGFWRMNNKLELILKDSLFINDLNLSYVQVTCSQYSDSIIINLDSADFTRYNIPYIYLYLPEKDSVYVYDRMDQRDLVLSAIDSLYIEYRIRNLKIRTKTIDIQGLKGCFILKVDKPDLWDRVMFNHTYKLRKSTSDSLYFVFNGFNYYEKEKIPH